MAKKLTQAKAKEILHDKSVHGHPLTDKQRRFFGAIAGGATPIAQNGIEGTMGGLTDKGFNYNGAWGGTMQMGGSLPGSVGFMYARTQSPAPSNGKYAKKTKASAQNGDDIKQVELPPVWIIGSKDSETEKFYKDFYDKLVAKKALSEGVTPEELENYINADPNYANKIMGEYQGMMSLGNKYGFPKVNPFSKEGIYNRSSGSYNPINETIYASDPYSWKSELAHYIQLKDNKLKKGLQWLGNDAIDYLQGKSPYKTPGSVEYEAHSIIEPDLDKQIEKVKQEYISKYKTGGNIIAQNGQEMRYYQEGLDFKPKTISKDGGWLSKYDDGGIIEDDMGQWAHPGLVTKINSNQITMQGVGYPVLGISDTGDTQMMQPGQDYKFDGNSVTEIPMAQDGITRGGYGDPDYVTGTSRRTFNKMVGMGNYLVPASALNRAADLAKTKGLDYGATTSGPADATRHAAAAASVASRLPIPQFIQDYSPAMDRAMRIAGANILGLGHEIMNPNSEGLFMDIKNNYEGSLIGSIPGLTESDRNKMIVNQLQKGRLTVDNPNKPKKENGGWLNKYE